MKETDCQHFNGIQHKTCRAGVSYDQFAGFCLPCLPFLCSNSSRPPGQCEKYVSVTPDQIAAREAEGNAAIQRIKKVTPLVKEIKKQYKGQNWAGVRECPVCQGKLHLTHARYNGHVHGKCETQDCLNWME